jgi:hypothetical protein
MPEFQRNGAVPANLSQVWEVMNGNKGDVERRCEQYAMWTVPYICPENNQNDSEVRKGNVGIGARLVNNLANRIVDVMFPNDRPFFSLPLTPKANRELLQEHNGDKAAAGKEMLAIRGITEGVVEDAMRALNLTQYRPMAVEAVKHSIITGGCIIRRHDDNLRTLYGIKNYAAYRDMRGRLTAVVLRDRKSFASLSQEHQQILTERWPGKYKQDADVTLYSYFEMLNEGHWIGVQGLDDVVINETYETYTGVTLPIMDLTWNLGTGDNYPRGLVEDNSVLFHNIDVTTEAVLDLIGIASDIKFLVNPASMLDVDELNAAERGSYHAGLPDDVAAVEFKHRAELQQLMEQVSAWERQLAQIFLLMSSVTRDAERVTAEEIRAQARELESAFGGLYSKLALSWQKREADYLIHTMDLDAAGLESVDVVVTTGLESLSREGQLDALRLAISDLQMLEAVPEDVRGVMDVRAFSEFVFTNRGVNFGQFIKTQDQIAADQQAAMQQEQELLAAQGAQQAATQAAAQAAQ